MKLLKSAKRKFKSYKNPLGKILIAWLLILFGWAVGSGNLTVNRGMRSVNGQLPKNLDYSSVEKVYDLLKSDYDGKLDETALLNGMKQGLASSLDDPYTEYFDNEEAKSFNEELSGTFTGIGAELGKQDKAITVISPLAGYPAEKAGLKPKDIIVKIDGESALDLTISEAVKKVRGPKDTKVKLTIVREGANKEIEMEITRAEISVPSVEHKILDNNIGYIKISRFGEDTPKLVSDAATEFKNANVKGVILDLRGDPGGLLDAAVSVSSTWLPKGQLILEEKRSGITIQRFLSKGPATLSGVPTVVLIDEGSASASEITAGALKDNKAATLIGVKSYGKGSVQQVENLDDGTVLKVTIARWFTPGGKNIDKEGISPDQEVKRSDDDYKNNRDPQLEAAKVQINK